MLVCVPIRGVIYGERCGGPKRSRSSLSRRSALYGLAEVRVDAGYGAILAGDLLTTSPTPGHAMIAVAPLPGTVVGKALEPLEAGTGRISVLVMPR